jgi:putative ABC transport system substrate-binding protein
MRRREFIALLSGAAAWPFGVRAQQITKLPTIGFMGSATPPVYTQWLNAFVERLREHDWTEGRTVTIEYRWAEGSYERAAEIAAEFVRMKVDVIVTSSTPNVLATKKATSEIPIIFASAGDPVGGGLVASLARPGGNVTGLSIQAAEITGKRIELLREALHNLSRLAIMGNGDNSAVVGEMRETQAAAEKLGLNAITFEIRRSEDIGPTFEKLKGHFDALYVPAEPLANTNRRRIGSFALAVHLPTLFGLQNTSRRVGLCLMGQTSQTFIGEPPILSTKFYAAQNHRRCRSSSRPSSTSRSV